MIPTANNINVGVSSERYFSGRTEFQNSKENQSTATGMSTAVALETANRVVNRSEVNANSANNLAAMTQPSACFTESAIRPSISDINDDRLFSERGFDKENRRNPEATARDPLNAPSSYESVTGTNTEVSDDANN